MRLRPEDSKSELATPGWDPAHRRKYADDPRAYLADILGIKQLTGDQEDLLWKMHHDHRVAAAAANAVGKTFEVAAYGVFYMDSWGSQLDEETGEPQGAVWLMTAPTGDQIFELIWGEALGHIRRAKRLGWQMGGFYSERSVKWRIREDWRVEGISPPRRTGEEQQHGGSGRHHRNLLYTIDEAAGVDHSRFRAAEGIASAATNKIILTFNPTEVVSPAKDAYDSAGYVNARLSAFDHPNVVHRKESIPGAISHIRTESRIKDWCEDRGPYEKGVNDPDPAFMDFLWNMHPHFGTDEAADIPEPRPFDEAIEIDGKEYRVLGHADGELRVYRPDFRFLPTVMGYFPADETGSLFPPAFLQKAEELWEEMIPPGGRPSQIGVDPAEEGGDEPIMCPAWHLESGIRYIGRLRSVRPGLPKRMAGDIYLPFSKGPRYVVDAIGVGSGVENELDETYGADTYRFKSSHTGKIPRKDDEPEFLNRRAVAYWRASMLVKQGKAALPKDPVLRRQLLATTYDFQQGKVRIIPKEKLKEVLGGQSPDRADAFVLSVYEDSEKRSAGGYQATKGGRARGRLPKMDPLEYYRRKAG